jgi:hypothetical protein
MLNQARKLGDLRSPPGNRLEALKGDRGGRHSIRINDQWRICFQWQGADAYDKGLISPGSGVQIPPLAPKARRCFGENLTTSGLLETDTHIGDVLRIGWSVLQVTHPRMPCAKLAHKFGRPELIKEFLLSGRSGFYLRVEEEGELGAGDDIEIVQRDPTGSRCVNCLG